MEDHGALEGEQLPTIWTKGRLKKKLSNKVRCEESLAGKTK